LAGVIRRPFGRLRERRAAESEHGAVATLVAVLLAGGVLLGIGAIVIDVGQLYIEREELQSGADAASMKVALNCVAVVPACDTPTAALVNAQTTIAGNYAKANAKDHQAVAQICFTNTGCPSTWNTAVTCPTLPAPAAGYTNGTYVEVRTATVTSTGATLVPPAFAGALAGSTYVGKRVGACARVSWGTPAVAKVIGLGISVCDWQRVTANNTNFYGPLGNLVNNGVLPLLGLSAPAAGNVHAIGKSVPPTSVGTICTVPRIPFVTPADQRPRGFVWLNNPDGSQPDANCMINVNVGDSPPNAGLLTNLAAALLSAGVCPAALKNLVATRATFFVPIYDAIAPSGLSTLYHIVGFAPFVATGYGGLLSGLVGSVLAPALNAVIGALFPDVPGILGGMPPDAGVQCAGGSCIWGYFTKTVLTMPKPQFGTGNNYGATVIGRTG
jgi:putative Flp pilus-assembly TadE/G-like protein